MPPNDDDILLPIHAGKALSNIDLHMQGDNEVNGQTCDNISDKNPIYNELTVIYWAWKNLKTLYPDVKYIGLFHYRRFLAFDKQQFFAANISEPTEAILNYKIDAEKLINILESGKIILAQKGTLPYPVADMYCIGHVSSNYRAVKNIIREKFPDYYDAFIEFMEWNNKMSYCNMFIMKWEDFEKYCEWIFSVLPLVEEDYLHNTEAAQRRFFISERLLNVYVRKHKMKAKYFNIYYYVDNLKPQSLMKKFLSYLQCFMYCCRCKAIMFFINLKHKRLMSLLSRFPLKH